MKDKNSIINAAQKFASRGSIDKAIAEWEKLLENGKDGNVQNTIGDLYMRKGSESEAVESFTKAAEIFRKDGFYPKAIAIYKKILNIVPNSVESIIALAKLNAKKGLNGAAADYYFKAADIFQRNGYAEKATTAVERILKLSSTDAVTRQKIAEWYIGAGMKPRAANEYSAIASGYLRKNDVENAEKFFTKASELDPDNISSLVGLSRVMEEKGDIEAAFKNLEDAMAQDPSSKDTMLAYSELSLKHNRVDAAKDTLLRLIKAAPSYNHPKKLLGSLYLDENKLEEAWEQFVPCIDDAVNEKRWSDAIDMLDKFRQLHPVPVRERIINIYTSAGDRGNLAKERLELAAIYEEQGSTGDALRLYRDIIESDPENSVAASKVNELETREEPAAAAEPAAEQAPEPAADTPVEPAATTPAAAEDMQLQIDPGKTEEAVIEKIVPGAETPADSKPLSHSEALLEKRKEAEFFAKQGLNDEAAAIYEELLKALPGNAAVKQRLEELRSASGPAEVVVKKMFDGEAEPSGEQGPGAEAHDLQSIFDTFTKEEDHEARYKAGLEAKQKGRLDEAIKEFRVAAEDPSKRLVSKSMIALCYMEKGAYADAVNEFTSVLDAMSPEDASYLRIKYELAGAYKKNGNDTRAFELYSEIKEQDPDFKDINSKIESVETSKKEPAEPEEKPKPKPKKKNRISYI